MAKNTYRLKTYKGIADRCSFKIQRKVWWGWLTVWSDYSPSLTFDKSTLCHAREMLKNYRELSNDNQS